MRKPATVLVIFLAFAAAAQGAASSKSQVNTAWLKKGIVPTPRVQELGCRGDVCRARMCDRWLTGFGLTWAYTRTRVVGQNVRPLSAVITSQRCRRKAGHRDRSVS